MIQVKCFQEESYDKLCDVINLWLKENNFNNLSVPDIKFKKDGDKYIAIIAYMTPIELGIGEPG